MKYCITRSINGVSLNGKEYLLDDNGNIQKMNYQEAIDFINTYGLSEDNLEIYEESVSK